ncbi:MULTISPECIES: AraC family transcriptional regulator [Reichenbachiella]|uniref:AraC family transcriptional regulator n=1 Tax=Reichenbachiella TaxID=156993 RepID=UPI000E6D50B7|nr:MULTISPECIES: helix-turn-helix domain-containing protein [Reichenbachiella]MBU2915009.1 helix-turn-helix domain-containing protein [Reichenbachiella agariperforans]RJE70439.1 AraC family transcriptional regulator [Reichenbachiella sp. MSK19-1]
MPQTLHIKNMVCPRCIASVKDIMSKLDIPSILVTLGEVQLAIDLSQKQHQQLSEALETAGFELIQDPKTKLIAQIKAIIIESIHLSNKALHVNFSTLLSEKLHHDYASLSRLFSGSEGITIEKYVLTQKIERVKELLFYNEQTLSQIAHDMHYSSVAHLSSQFKKETGMTPSAFKKSNKPGHTSRETI